MHTNRGAPCFSTPMLGILTTLALACGDSGGGETTAASSTGEVGESTAPPGDDTTGEPPTTGGTTGEGTSTGGGTTTTGEPAVCDGRLEADAFACTACTECGDWINPAPDGSYPAAMICMFEGLRDGKVVGATYGSCMQGICDSTRLISTGTGMLISQQVIINEMNMSMNYLGIQQLPLQDAAFFEACLAAYDPNCAVTNSWFTGASMDLTEVTCP